MKQPVALLINDIHVNKDNIAEFEKNWNEALEVCAKYKIEDLVVGGDMFTTRSSQTLATLIAVKYALTRAVRQNIYPIVAEGNHDLTDQESIIGYNHLFEGLSGIEIVSTHLALCWEGVDVILLVMSYFPENGSFLDRLENAVEDTLIKNPNYSKSDIILYIHEGVHGAHGNMDIPGELPQEPLQGFRAVLCGHYHNRTKIKDTNIEYIGSSRQHNFGEDEEKGYTILFDDGSYGFVKNEVNTRYKTIELTAKEAAKFQLDQDPRYKYKIKVKCTEQEIKNFDKQKLIEAGFNKIELIANTEIPKEIAASGIQEKYDREGIKKEYQNYCSENAIDSELGIKYLEG